MNTPPPRLRPLPDRLRQLALFELGGLMLLTPPFMLISGMDFSESFGLLAMIAALAAVWNGCYNTSFDWCESRLVGRKADSRPLRLRVAHALGFEGGLLMMTLPLLVWGTGMSWAEALLADVGIALAYVGYAFLFNLGYDRLFPIAGPAGGRVLLPGE